MATQKCGAFKEYIIKRHNVAPSDTKVWCDFKNFEILRETN